MVIRQPCGDQWKAEKLGAFCADQKLDVSSKVIVASLIIEHTVNFALSGNSHGPCNTSIINVSDVVQCNAYCNPEALSVAFSVTR